MCMEQQIHALDMRVRQIKVRKVLRECVMELQSIRSLYV